MIKELDSINANSIINWVCSDCGKKAMLATKGINVKSKYISTYHIGICDFCEQEKPITQTRDFKYPNFNLIKKPKCKQ